MEVIYSFAARISELQKRERSVNKQKKKERKKKKSIAK